MARRVSRLVLSICLLASLSHVAAFAQTAQAPPAQSSSACAIDPIADQGANDLVTALKNVPGVNAFTTYGVYEYYAFRG